MFRILLAQKVIELHPMYSLLYQYCKEYVTLGTPDIVIHTTPEDIEFERVKAAEENRLEGLPPRLYSPSYLETLSVYRKISLALLDYDTFLFHGSCIAMGGVGYLFTATSGTGKSTHVRLWQELFGSRVRVVNDDKPLLQFTERGVTAWGTPWNGKHRLGMNIGVPLKAVCILQRDTTNHIQPISPKEAFPVLFQQAYRPQEEQALEKVLELTDRLSNAVSLYVLGCNMELEAARVAHDGMNQEDKT